MLKETLSADMKDAMRARDRVRLGTIRMIQTAIMEREKSGAGEASEAEVIAIVTKQAKQRRDAMAQFTAAGRDDLAAIEAAELAVVEGYLPTQLTDDEVAGIVTAVVAETGAASMKDMGRVMGEAMTRTAGQADGARVQAAVRRALSGDAGGASAG